MLMFSVDGDRITTLRLIVNSTTYRVLNVMCGMCASRAVVELTISLRVV